MTLPPFQELLDLHGRDVHRFLIASVGRIDADDCYQETWLSAMRAYPRLKDAGNLKAWLFTIAHRKVIDHVRRARRGPIPTDELPETPTTDAGPRDDALWAAVAELPPKQRSAVALRFVIDADYALIGETMGTSEEAARRNVFEGLRRLRKEYDQ